MLQQPAHFYELAGRNFLLALPRSPQDLTLIVIDLGFSRKINDSLGHAAGDLALREFVLAVKPIYVIRIFFAPCWW
ncbi:MAG: diguanylate cyclase [Dechloromonas sp.]|uniref:Diguanylate cyclase n=1 Tax=Candidatus Dechloromonas phosphorivorans TaxID=2899244 RepID=A0A935K423_9RHOO|nr:diguanylate cyclase [Candidatus Dechloromonas phosphorivorans]